MSPVLKFHSQWTSSFTLRQKLLLFTFRRHREQCSKLPLTGPIASLRSRRNRPERKFSFTSSGAVYGKSAGLGATFSEDSASTLSTTNQSSAYGEGKRVSEMLGTLAAAVFGFEFIIARLFAFVGPFLRLDGHCAIGNFIGDGLRHGKITVKGDGTAIRSYMYSAELAGLVGRVCEKEVEIMQTPKPNLVPERYLPLVLKAAKELGLNLYHSLEDSISKTVLWHRQFT